MRDARCAALHGLARLAPRTVKHGLRRVQFSTARAEHGLAQLAPSTVERGLHCWRSVIVPSLLGLSRSTLLTQCHCTVMLGLSRYTLLTQCHCTVVLGLSRYRHIVPSCSG